MPKPNSGLYSQLESKVFHFLAYRARSEKEVRAYLWRKLAREDLAEAVKEGLVEKIVTKLTKLHFLDDSSLAERVVAEGRRQLKGRRRIYLDLKKKGLATSALSPPSDSSSPSEEDLARAAATKRARFYQNLDSQTFRRRLAGYLARRGFDWEVILPVVDRLAPKR